MDIDLNKCEFVGYRGSRASMYNELYFEYLPFDRDMIFYADTNYYYITREHIKRYRFDSVSGDASTNTLYFKYRAMHEVIMEVTKEYEAYLRQQKIKSVLEDGIKS